MCVEYRFVAGLECRRENAHLLSLCPWHACDSLSKHGWIRPDHPSFLSRGAAADEGDSCKSSDPAVVSTPPVLIAFDVLQADSHDVRRLPLGLRRPILEDALDGSQLVLPVRRLESHGDRAWATVERRGLEGFVAKDPASTYRVGPTRSWIKVKLRHERVFVVGGIRNVDAFDGVLVGETIDGELLYRGVVEWSLDGAATARGGQLSEIIEGQLRASRLGAGSCTPEARRRRSALFRRLRNETTEMRHDLRTLALGAFHVCLFPLRESHDQFEWLVALLAHELIARHSMPSLCFLTVIQR
jgi:ATP dependent DNA ligase domain